MIRIAHWPICEPDRRRSIHSKAVSIRVWSCGSERSYWRIEPFGELNVHCKRKWLCDDPDWTRRLGLQGLGRNCVSAAEAPRVPATWVPRGLLRHGRDQYSWASKFKSEFPRDSAETGTQEN